MAEGCGRDWDRISYRGREWRTGRAFEGERMTVRPGKEEGRVQVYYCKQQVRELDLRVQPVSAECV